MPEFNAFVNVLNGQPRENLVSSQKIQSLQHNITRHMLRHQVIKIIVSKLPEHQRRTAFDVNLGKILIDNNDISIMIKYSNNSKFLDRHV